VTLDNPAASIPATAQSSSLSPTSPEMPTAPTTSSPGPRISTPPGDGTMRPFVTEASVATKVGNFVDRS
jgi:hypothetical protein